MSHGSTWHDPANVETLVRMKREGKSHREIAGAIGCHRGSVSSKLAHMARPVVECQKRGRS